ncbi:MAG TPA: HAD family phosphatase [Candidatus Dormibacteraeota bacterium]|nr:HAD family phosphatase [Candidatus Dormibacteraeota bacterium]
MLNIFLRQVCGGSIYKVPEVVGLPKITTLFWDIGGVILTNGWDRESRKEAAVTFHLDWEELQDRHDLSFPAFDSGLITLKEYLDRTLFYRSRPFSREEFTAFMFAQSKEYPETRAILDKITSSQKYFVGAINNEPLELNQYRIEAFHLRRNFQVFFSSCYVHSRKPEEAIFRVALEITQRPPEQCLFIDDRALNLENPRKLGMNTIHHQDPEQLRAELRKYGVEV